LLTLVSDLELNPKGRKQQNKDACTGLEILGRQSSSTLALHQRAISCKRCDPVLLLLLELLDRGERIVFIPRLEWALFNIVFFVQ
jgi:hypothetical protein